MFPLIPLPIKEATYYVAVVPVEIDQVSINSTSYKRSDNLLAKGDLFAHEIVSINSTSYKRSDPHLQHLQSQNQKYQFPLIPLPIKEATR